MIKLCDIARELGLNISVVSRALNPSPDKNAVVKKATVTLIRETAQRMGYRPNRQASFLGKGQCATIFCFLPDTPTRLINDLMFGITETACQENFPVNFFFSQNENGFQNFLCHSEENAHSGLLTLPPGKMPPSVLNNFSRYYHLGGKILFLNTFSNVPDGSNFSEFSDIPCLNIDEYYGGRLAAKHLMSCNCDEFILVSANENDIYALREKGFCDQLQQNGAAVHKISFEELKNLPLKKQKIGFFADSDYMALNMYPILAAQGVKIGKNILICGFDDIFYSRISMPSLSTVHQPTRQEGNIAVHKLMKMIYGAPAENEVVRPFVMMRESTGGKRPDPEYPEQEDILRTIDS